MCMVTLLISACLFSVSCVVWLYCSNALKVTKVRQFFKAFALVCVHECVCYKYNEVFTL